MTRRSPAAPRAATAAGRPAELVHIEIGDLEAEVPLQPLAGVQHRVVLDLRGDDVSHPRCSACARPTPLIARLSLSLPQPVKMISLARPSTWAMRSRASSSARRAADRCVDAGRIAPVLQPELAHASTTRGSTGVVAALSR